MKNLIQHYQKKYHGTVTPLNLVRNTSLFTPGKLQEQKAVWPLFGPGLLRSVSATGQMLQNINLRQNFQFGIHVLGHKPSI